MKKVIVNFAFGSVGSWYFLGQKKLYESLCEFGEKENCAFSGEQNNSDIFSYDSKVLAIKYAAEKADLILWLDCSITAKNDLRAIWQHIETEGVYLYQSGANCAETCNDACLNKYGITRDQAELIPECASNVVGINLKHPVGKKFFHFWTMSVLKNANQGIKWPNEEQRKVESEDPRFKYHRQDQSTASLAAHLAGVKLDQEGNFVARAENQDVHTSDSIIFVLKGGVNE